MSHLYQHLLIPPCPEFVPELGKIALFFDELETLGALPNERKFSALTLTGGTRLVGRNPMTGQEYYIPEFNVSLFPERQNVIDAVNGENAFDLSVEGKGPTGIPPFDLYSADNYADRRPGILWKGPHSFTVHCRLRSKTTHFLHSPLGCSCEIHPHEPGIFQIPWNNKPIQTPGPACARFWVEFSVGNYLMPLITDSLEIVDTRLLAAANRVFGVHFTQGCRINED